MNYKENEKLKILVADDSEMNRMILTDMLSDEYEILEAENGKQAVEQLQQYRMNISLMLLDIVMPEMDGFEVLALMNKHRWIDQVPVIMISAENGASVVERAYDLGVTDYISRPFDVAVVQRRVHNTILLYAKQRKLTDLVTEQVYENQKMASMTVNILSHIVEFRNGESGLHVLHITIMTEILLRRLMEKTDQYPLKESDVSLIATAAAMHDIGKISISSEILNKPGKLTDEEYEIMKTHSAVGASMLDSLPQYKDEPMVKMAWQICRWHHERYDGRGYPDGLKGDAIPISAQVVALADVYDALTSKRVYKPAIPHDKAISMILNGECGAFNPILLECLVDEGENIHRELALNSLSDRGERALRNAVVEMLDDAAMSKIDYTLFQMDREREKNQFFAALSREIQFDYSWESKTLTISDWSPHKLGLAPVIYNPIQDPAVLEIVGRENIDKLVALLGGTTPEEPVIEMDMNVTVGNEHRWHHCICRADWGKDEEGNKKLVGFLGKAHDTHEQWKHMDALQRIASHDMLTGLYNRSYITREAKQALEDVGRKFAMIIFDLDLFKQVNDQKGHLFGDEVLKHIAGQLKHSVRRSDMAARIGGDEFLIFIEYGEHCEAIVNRIFCSLGGPYQDLNLTISMGISTTDAVGRDFQKLFLCADRALYYSKRNGKNLATFYDESMKDMLSVLSPIEDHSGDGEDMMAEDGTAY